MNARNVGVTSSLKAVSSPGSRCLSAFYHSYSVPAYYVQDGRNLCFAEMLGSSRASQKCSGALVLLASVFWRSAERTFDMTLLDFREVFHRMKQCLTVDGYNEI